jgi:hypothetical protein
MSRVPHQHHRLKWLPVPWLLLALVVPMLVAPAQAQLLGAVPEIRIPAVAPVVDRVVDTPRELQARVADPVLRRLLQRHSDLVALDPHGAAIVRNEVVAIDPDDAALALARANGFEVGAPRGLDELGLRVAVLRAPAGVDTATALARLRALDPHGSYDFNHLYSGSASTVDNEGEARAPPSAATTGPLRIGLIDSGVSRTHPALRGVEIHAWGCDGKQVPGKHGTAIASLLAATTLYSADIYCGAPTGGSATAFAAAMGWMAREHVAVVNISLVGPDNALLRRATEALLARGYVLVAAVGNDGPAAAPLFPAAYPGVLGVTAVDARERVLPEALRGAQVDFAAFGSGLRVADPDGGWHKARGTSYAAPLVARAAAAAIAGTGPGEGVPAKVRAQLEAAALDLGARGRDDTYGYGLVSAKP